MMAAKRRRQPYRPPVAVDLGPDTPAQRTGTVLEFRVHRGQQVQGRRREHPLDRLHRTGAITEPQRDAGFALLDAWCECQRSPEQSGVYVQNTPDWAALALQAAERNAAWSDLYTLVPRDSRRVIGHVVIEGRPLYRLPRYLSSVRPRVVNVRMARRYRAQLVAGLDALRTKG